MIRERLRHLTLKAPLYYRIPFILLAAFLTLVAWMLVADWIRDPIMPSLIIGGGWYVVYRKQQGMTRAETIALRISIVVGYMLTLAQFLLPVLALMGLVAVVAAVILVQGHDVQRPRGRKRLPRLVAGLIVFSMVVTPAATAAGSQLSEQVSTCLFKETGIWVDGKCTRPDNYNQGGWATSGSAFQILDALKNLKGWSDADYWNFVGDSTMDFAISIYRDMETKAITGITVASSAFGAEQWVSERQSWMTGPGWNDLSTWDETGIGLSFDTISEAASCVDGGGSWILGGGGCQFSAQMVACENYYPNYVYLHGHDPYCVTKAYYEAHVTNLATGAANQIIDDYVNGQEVKNAQVQCSLDGWHWIPEILSCVETQLDVKIVECSLKGLSYYQEVSQCMSQGEADKYACTQYKGHWADGQCYENKKAHEQYLCTSSGKQWYVDKCMTHEEIDQYDCAQQNGYWGGGQCYVNRQAYEQDECALDGNQWYRNYCYETYEDFRQAWCDDLNGYLAPDLECYEDEGAYEMLECALSSDWWVDTVSQCMGGEEFLEWDCDRLSGVQGAGGECYLPADLRLICEYSGYVWDAGKQTCYHLGNAIIPRGLEGLYVAIQDPQQQLEGGEFQDIVNQLLARVPPSDASFEEAMVFELNEWLRLEQQAIESEFEYAVAEATPGLDVTPLGRAQALNTRSEQMRALAQTADYLLSRIESTMYPDYTTPDGASQALADIGGRGSYATIAFPSGFPTPREVDGNFMARIPVEVKLPKSRIPGLTEVAVPLAVDYVFSYDGGDSYWENFVELPGQPTTRINFNINQPFPLAAAHYDLRVGVAVEYETDFYLFSGEPFTIPQYRQAPVLQRDFYSTANPWASPPSSSTQSAQASQEQGSATSQGASDDEQAQQQYASGQQPGGAAAAMNAMEYQAAKAQASANEFDQKAGLGLGLLFKALPWLAGGGAVLILIGKGWLDWVPGIKDAKRWWSRRRNRDSELLSGSPDDILEGI